MRKWSVHVHPAEGVGTAKSLFHHIIFFLFSLARSPAIVLACRRLVGTSTVSTVYLAAKDPHPLLSTTIRFCARGSYTPAWRTRFQWAGERECLKGVDDEKTALGGPFCEQRGARAQYRAGQR